VGMRGCYAYKKGKKAEDLAKHLVDVAECCKEHTLRNPVAIKIAKEYGKHVDYIKDLIVASCLLHDIGKACEHYQKNCDVGCEEFSGHDVRSYKLTATAIQRLNWSVEDEVLRTALLVPILGHHYFQREPNKVKNDLSSVGNIHIWSSCTNDLPAMLREKKVLFKTQEVKDLIEEVAKLIERGCIVVGATNANMLYNELQNFTSIFWKLAAVAVTAIVNECDGRVAYVNRR